MLHSPVFLSGGSGFVGTAVVRELLQRGYPVRAVVHSRGLRVEDARVTCFRGELDDVHVVERVMAGCSAAIHLVGIIAERTKEGVTFHRMHVDFTRRVVDECVKANVTRYVHMSEAGARADGPAMYHQTKAAAEQIVRASPLAWTIFRPSLIHGADGELIRMLLGWVDGKQIPYAFMPYFGGGVFGQGREYLVQPVGVEDVARAFVDALERPGTIGRQYDLGGAQRLSWREMYQHFAMATRHRRKMTVAIPAWYALLLARLLPGNLLPFNGDQVRMSQEDNIADMAAFQADFGYTPEGFDVALAKYAGALGR